MRNEAASGSRRGLFIAIVLATTPFLPPRLAAAPKISVRAFESLGGYNRVYVVAIRNDTRRVEPRLVERLKKAGLDTVDLQTQSLPFASQGTGFVLSPEGQVLTCAHVVGNEAQATLWIEGVRYYGHVVALDTNLDAAVILAQGDHPPFQPLVLAGARTFHLGQAVATMGFPAANLLGSQPRLSKREISSTVGLENDPRHLQISTALQPGNSGGPLLDEGGQVIGMVDSTLDAARFLLMEGALPQNVNFAIKSDFLLRFLSTNSIRLPEAGTNGSAFSTRPQEERYDAAGKSLALVRGGVVDDRRLKERPLLCRCSYASLPYRGDEFFRLRIDFIDPVKLRVALSANLDEQSTASANKVLDAMFERICDQFYPDKPNPFNPRKKRADAAR